MNAAPDFTPSFTEDCVSQLPALHLLQKLGWTLLPPIEALRLRGGRMGSVLLLQVLEKQLAAINEFEYRGQPYSFTSNAISEGVRALTNIDDLGLVRTNERLWDLIRFGKAVPQTIDGDTKSYTLKFVDWEHPERNEYHVSDEFAIQSFGSTATRRPDIVLFVNGIPFVVIECKRPGDVGGEDPLGQAINQQLRNQRVDEIPALFHYTQMIAALAVDQAKYGATGTQPAFWNGWRELHVVDDPLPALLKTPLTPEETAATFAPDRHRFCGSNAKAAQRWLEHDIEQGRTPTVQDRLLLGICTPCRVLALAGRYSIFEAGERKIARYQQYFAVEDILRRVEEVSPDGQRQGGLIWHTQGSGKSLTMVMLAEALVEKFAALSPQVVLVTDRVDLDDQIYGTFVSAGVETSQASTGRHLLELMKSSRTQVVTTLLQKFESAVNVKDTVLDSPNIFVLIDEGHRSHTGAFHAAMRRVMPNACLIAFTGTPVFRSQVPTTQRFGGLIGEPYTITQATADKAVVPLRYEGRHVQQHVNELAIDAWFQRYTVGLTEAQQADLKRKYSSADQLNRAEQKIRAIAWDISVHYKNNYQGTGLKGQLVAPSKAAAIQYRQFLNEFGIVASEVLISPPDVSEGQVDVAEPKADVVVPFWREMMERYGTEAKYQKDLTNRFKTAETPEIIVVVDKLLTGFDAPRNTVLYLTRSLKDHKLLQAIARVNRLFPGKDYGLIVDYYGVLDHLSEALEQYADAPAELEEHLREALTPIESAAAELPQRHSALWDVFRGVKNHNDLEAMVAQVRDWENRQQFYERLTDFALTLRTAFASVEFHTDTAPALIDRYRGDLKYFVQLRATVARRYAETVDYKDYQASIQKLLDTYVSASDVEVLVEPVSILDRDSFAREVEKIPTDAGRAETIANRTKLTIHEHLDEDPVFYKRFSELIDQTIADMLAGRLTAAEALRRLSEASKNVRDRRSEQPVPEALRNRDVARTYYDLVRDELGAAKISISDEVSAALAVRIDDIINGLRKVSWTEDPDRQNQMKIAIEDALFEMRDQIGAEVPFESVDRLLDRAIDVARRRLA